MSKYPTPEYLKNISNKIDMIHCIAETDPVEYTWKIFNPETGIHKQIFTSSLTKQEVKNATDIFLKSTLYKGIFSYGESMKILYIIKRLQGEIKVKSNFTKDEKLELENLLKKYY